MTIVCKDNEFQEGTLTVWKEYKVEYVLDKEGQFAIVNDENVVSCYSKQRFNC
jgi:hypothetical protein